MIVLQAGVGESLGRFVCSFCVTAQMFAFKLELISATLCGPQSLNPNFRPKTPTPTPTHSPAQLQLEPELKAEEEEEP